MKPILTASLFAAAAVASSGCAPLDQSIFVEGASFLDESCAPSGDTKLIRGSLDLGPSVATGALPRYFASFGLRSDLEPITTESGDDVLAGDSRNEFVATTVNLAYSTTGGFSAAAVNEPIFFVVAPATDDNTIQFNMLNAAAAQAIAGAVAPGGSDTLLVTFHFEGNVRSATNALLPMKTPPVTFPIRLFNNGVPTCTAPDVLIVDGPCGNSQETFALSCG